jgi:acetyltransferase-like isoleucine patch superfamily enzyme
MSLGTPTPGSKADSARGAWHGLRRRWRRFAGRLLFVLSEHEAIGLAPGTAAPWRARLLRHRGVRHGARYYVGRGFWLHDGGKFAFGERCSLGEFARIMDHGPITLGDDFIAATGLQINSGTHDVLTMEPSQVPITVGNRVWCGANVTLVAGATIGDDVVIGAGSLVRTAIPPGSVAAGVPARVIRKLERSEAITWHLP